MKSISHFCVLTACFAGSAYSGELEVRKLPNQIQEKTTFLNADKIRLKFEINKAKLYSFSFAE